MLCSPVTNRLAVPLNIVLAAGGRWHDTESGQRVQPRSWLRRLCHGGRLSARRRWRLGFSNRCARAATSAAPLLLRRRTSRASSGLLGGGSALAAASLFHDLRPPR